MNKDEYKTGEGVNKRFMYMYFYKTDKKVEDLKIQYEELSEIKYINLEEMKRIVREKDENYTFATRGYAERIIQELEERGGR